jgi:hypothetical protein
LAILFYWYATGFLFIGLVGYAWAFLKNPSFSNEVPFEHSQLGQDEKNLVWKTCQPDEWT